MAEAIEQSIPQDLPEPPRHFGGLVANLRYVADLLQRMDDEGSSFEIDRPVFQISPKGWKAPTDKDNLAAIARTFAPTKKIVNDFNFSVEHEFSGLVFRAYVNRDSVCRKVEKLVPQMVWECPSLLADDEYEEVAK